jgi:phosphoglycolate phosphatase
MLQLEAIVWDLDGTLVDSAPDLATALNSVLDKRGFAGLSLEVIRTMIGNGVPKLVERGFNALGIRLDTDQLDELVAMFVKEYKACATDQTRPYPLVVETLEQIRSMNIPMGVCTNKPEVLSRQILDGLGLSGYFNSVIGGDSTPTRKPDALPLLTCLAELATAPRNSMMIGDSIVDVKAARAAKVIVAVVPWGYRNTAIEDLAADFVIRDLAELPNIIETGARMLQPTAH